MGVAITLRRVYQGQILSCTCSKRWVPNWWDDVLVGVDLNWEANCPCAPRTVGTLKLPLAWLLSILGRPIANTVSHVRASPVRWPRNAGTPLVFLRQERPVRPSPPGKDVQPQGCSGPCPPKGPDPRGPVSSALGVWSTRPSHLI